MKIHQCELLEFVDLMIACISPDATIKVGPPKHHTDPDVGINDNKNDPTRQISLRSDEGRAAIATAISHLLKSHGVETVFDVISDSSGADHVC